MSKQIIIVDSAEALAELIAEKLSMNAPHVVAAIASCLHPIEVPNDAGKLVQKLRTKSWITTGSFPYQDFTFSFDKAAALITAHSRTVPRAMLDEIWLNGYQCANGKKDTNMADIAAKYGYHAE